MVCWKSKKGGKKLFWGNFGAQGRKEIPNDAQTVLGMWAWDIGSQTSVNPNRVNLISSDIFCCFRKEQSFLILWSVIHCRYRHTEGTRKSEPRRLSRSNVRVLDLLSCSRSPIQTSRNSQLLSERNETQWQYMLGNRALSLWLAWTF